MNHETNEATELAAWLDNHARHLERMEEIGAMPESELTPRIARAAELLRQQGAAPAPADEGATIPTALPSLPPRPPVLWPHESPPPSRLARYGIQWNGPEQPISTLMADGYWTPWHVADELLRLAEDSALTQATEGEAAELADWLDNHVRHLQTLQVNLDVMPSTEIVLFSRIAELLRQQAPVPAPADHIIPPADSAP